MIRLLVVDDSALMRRLLKEIFEAEDGFEAAFARDGVEAMAMLHAFRPDVVTLDIHMPNMDGLACLDRIMLERPCPVVMFSTLTDAGAKETLDALALGAVDFALKPSGAVSLKVDDFGPALVEKVRIAAASKLARSRRLAERVRLRTRRDLAAADGRATPSPRSPNDPPPKDLAATAPAPKVAAARGRTEPTGERLVLAGASTGGPPALDALLSPLPADFPWPIVIAQHMPASFTSALAARLDRLCALKVAEIVRPVELQAGCVYVGRGDADVIVSRRGEALVALPAPSSAAHRWHPSVDRLVASAMEVADPRRLVGVLMTGMGDDGAAAMTRLHGLGGATIAEAEDTAVVWGMPGELARLGGAAFIEPLERIAGRLLSLTASA